MLTVEEVAAWMRVSKMTVYRLINKGVLPAFAVSQRVFRVYECDLKNYLADCVVVPVAVRGED